MSDIVPFDCIRRILTDCSAVIWGEEGNLSYPGLSDDDEVFLHLDNGNDVFMKFREVDNKEVDFSCSKFWLKNTDGNKVEITPLFSGVRR